MTKPTAHILKSKLLKSHNLHIEDSARSLRGSHSLFMDFSAGLIVVISLACRSHSVTVIYWSIEILVC